MYLTTVRVIRARLESLNLVGFLMGKDLIVNLILLKNAMQMHSGLMTNQNLKTDEKRVI